MHCWTFLQSFVSSSLSITFYLTTFIHVIEQLVKCKRKGQNNMKKFLSLILLMQLHLRCTNRGKQILQSTALYLLFSTSKCNNENKVSKLIRFGRPCSRRISYHQPLSNHIISWLLEDYDVTFNISIATFNDMSLKSTVRQMPLTVTGES